MLKPPLDKNDFLYTALFCEENIWQLTNALTSQSLLNSNQMWVLIITSTTRKLPLRNQQAVETNQIVIWDYHVVLQAEYAQQHYICDFDTRLPFVSPLDDYIQGTFIEPELLPEPYQPVIRKVPASAYLQQFFSDRSHMLGQISRSEFPDWPLINQNKPSLITLMQYLDLQHTLNDGSQVCTPASLQQLCRFLSGVPL